MGCFDTACGEEEGGKEEAGEPAIKKREATEIEKNDCLGIIILKKIRPCPDEMDVVSLWQPHAQNKLFLWTQDWQLEKLEDSRCQSSANDLCC